MYIKLIRNQPKGNALTGRLVINGRWFCDTLERVGYQIPALCYHVAVTMSPKFKRRLPIVQNVPQTGDKAMRQGIRFHRGTKPEHSTYIRQNEKCAFYKTKSATKFQKQQTPIAKVCCFF